MNSLAGLLMALAFQPAPTPPYDLARATAVRAGDCVRLKATPLAATNRSVPSIAYQTVRACEPELDELTARAERAQSAPERNLFLSLREDLIEYMISVAEQTIQQQREP